MVKNTFSVEETDNLESILYVWQSPEVFYYIYFYTMPEKIQPIRILDSCCIFNGITSILPIMHCAMSKVCTPFQKQISRTQKFKLTLSLPRYLEYSFSLLSAKHLIHIFHSSLKDFQKSFSSPGKCHNQIPGHSKSYSMRTNLVCYIDCVGNCIFYDVV